MARWYPKFDYLPQPLRAKAVLEGISLDLAESYYEEANDGLPFWII